VSSWARQLITAVVQEKNLKELIDKGITKKTFSTESIADQLVIEDIWEWYHSPFHYGEVMSAEHIKERHNTFEFAKPTYSIGGLIDALKTEKLKQGLKLAVGDISDLIESEPAAALAVMMEQVRVLSASVQEQDVDFAVGIKDYIEEEYHRIQANGGYKGYPWPWPQLTNSIGGLDKGQLITLYGVPKSGKTWIGLLIGAYLYRERHLKVLVYSREMTYEQLKRRTAMILSDIDDDRFSKAELSDKELEQLGDTLAGFEHEAKSSLTLRRMIFTRGMSSEIKDSKSSIEMLRTKIEEWKPDIVVVDSAYHLSGSSDWKFITQLTQNLKALAIAANIPIIAITQENERKAQELRGAGRGTASIAMSPSWIQDCDTAIRVVNDWEGSLSLHVAACRERHGKGIRIVYAPAVSFDYLDQDLVDTPEKRPDPNTQVAPSTSQLPQAKAPKKTIFGHLPTK